jgi:hypothetical protein
MQTLSDLHSSEEDGEGNGVSVDQNEREVPNEESNPFKSCLRRESCYLNWVRQRPCAPLFPRWCMGFELGRSRGYSHGAHVSWAGSKTYYERVELPAVSLSGVHGQACLRHGRAHAIHDRQDRKSPD